MTDPIARLLVCGNVDRSDDGAAIWAVAGLLPSLREEGRWHVEVVRCSQLDIEHLLDSPAGVPLIIVDAAAGVPPGEIVTLTFDELLARRHGPIPHSSHVLPIDQVLGIARALGGGAPDGLFVGIGGDNFEHGRSLSAPVARVMPAFRHAIATAIRRVALAPSGGGG